jgi:hypothetical protein
MQSTITVKVGKREIVLPILRSAHQRLRYLREYFAAVEAAARLPDGASVVDRLDIAADVELAIAAGIVRMLTAGHLWRERYEANEYQSAAEPWRGMGADLLELAESEGISAEDLGRALSDMLEAGGDSPTADQVEEARGNSGATLS